MGRPKGSLTKAKDLNSYWLPNGVTVKTWPENFNKEMSITFIDSIHGEFVSSFKALQRAGCSVHKKARALRKSINNPGQTPEAKAKRKTTNLKKWGYESHMQNPEFRKSLEENNRNKLGVSYALESSKIRQKAISVKLEKNKKDYPIDGYLTEEKLGVVLGEIFPDAEIKSQVVWVGRRVADYMVTFEPNHPFIANLKNFIIEKDCPVTLVIEFDGHHHYNSSSKVYSDTELGFCPLDYVELDNNAFLLRIPYWIQLTNFFMKKWFFVDADYSNNYPLGFISRHCKLPNNYSSDGDVRFFNELEALPEKERNEVLTSLKNKAGKRNIRTVMSAPLIDLITKYFTS